MEITVCDIGSFKEKIFIEPEMTCKDLKNKISSLFGRDASNCAIYYDHAFLDDYKKIIPNSSIPYIILDKNIEKNNSRLDFDHLFYSSSRFSNLQQYNSMGFDRRSFLLTNLSNHVALSESSSDYEDSVDEDNDINYIADLDNNSDGYDDNSEIEDIIQQTNLADNDIDDHIEDSDSDETFDFVSHINNNNRFNSTNDSYNNNFSFSHHDRIYRHSTFPISNQNESHFEHHVPSAPFLLSSADIVSHRSTNSSSENIDSFHLLSENDDELNDDLLIEYSFQRENDNNNINNENQLNITQNQLNITLTSEENEVINRIYSENQRFDRLTIIQVYEACGRDAETTTQCLNTM